MPDSLSKLVLPSLFVLVSRLPIFIVWGVGAGLALYRLDRHRRPSLLLVTAAAVLAGADVLFTVLTVTLPMWLTERGDTTAQVGIASSAVGVASSLVHAVGYGLLVAAALTDRPERAGAVEPSL